MQASGSADSIQTPSRYDVNSSSAAGVICEDPYAALSTRRFRFRPFTLTDVGRLAALLGELRVADASIGIPHPYTEEFARMWMSSESAAWHGRRALHWAAHEVDDDRIAGYAGLHNIDGERRQAELRFWVGRGVQRRTDAVEWSGAVVEFAWTALNLNRIYALQLGRHPLAGRVLADIGMQREGLIRRRVYKEGLFEDVVCWATASDPLPHRSGPRRLQAFGERRPRQ
jgi:ribosomal-protein-alanine N-acetyltransferase